ncbi:TPA: hypothetical protein N0F65_012758 [Lagenidium giganteum]|uniref:peptidylprolyl isomerase n=1 Tax=Lagenidium giganteum TaxID=4803 RepID=A0AAV2YGK7_9STRA|nr:TPA: hypothetical protein N0F65_012758 [Lagenidium giganteum]
MATTTTAATKTLLVSPEEADAFEDVLGSGGILRKLLRSSEGEQCEFGEEVTIRYSEYVLATDTLVLDDHVRKFRVGDGEVMPALELISKMMRVGEVSEVRCEPRFAYGDKGRAPDVPAGAAMKLVIEVLRVGKKITAEMSSTELIEEATKKKDSGNRYFKDKNYEQAAKMYKRALKILESWEPSDEEAPQCKALLIALGNNVANVQHKLGQTREARQSSLEVLQLDENNLKALYRLGQLCVQENDFSDANKFLKQALALDQNNPKIRELIQQLKEKKQAHKERERKLFAKLGESKPDPAAQNVGGDAAVATQAFDWKTALRKNVPLLSAVVTAIIGLLMFQFIGKPYHGMD